MWHTFSWQRLTLLTIIVIFLLSVINYLTSYSPNDCSMTFMFDYPEFHKIKMPADVVTRFPSYNLFAYGEGGHSVMMKRMKFSGHPVLFIPGNAGSYRQVRSIASICHQMCQSREREFRFDFFTIDFDEEKAGLLGQLLQTQVKFAAAAVTRIQDIYKKNGRTNVSCIVIGHSVGGVVARSLMMQDNFTPACVSMLITLSSPIRQPVVSFDQSMVSLYKDTNDKWIAERQKPDNESKISHLMHVSIAGGFNDLLVRSELAMSSDVGNSDNRDISLITTSIPDVWLTMDHLCITWCKELMIKLSRTIYDVVAAGPEAGMDLRTDIVKYHLMKRTRGKTYPFYVVPKSFTFPSSGQWISHTKRFIRYTSPHILSPVYVLIELKPQTTIFVHLRGPHRHDWIATCNGFFDDDRNATICESGINLSMNTSLIPGVLHQPPVSVFMAEADSLRGTHVIVSLTPQVDQKDNEREGTASHQVSLMAERFDEPIRNMKVDVRLFWSLFSSSLLMLDKPVSRETYFYNISLIGITNAWHAYTVTVRTGSCYSSADQENPSIALLHSPWSHEDVYHRISNAKNTVMEFMIKLNVPRPLSHSPESHASLVLYLEPECAFKVTIKYSIISSLGQVIRFYYQYLINFIIGIAASVIALQMILMKSKSAIPAVADEVEEQEYEEVGGGDELRTSFTSSFIGSHTTVFFHEPCEKILRTRFLTVMLYGFLPTSPFVCLKVISLLPKGWQDSSVMQQVTSLRQNDLTDLQFVLLFLLISIFAYGILYIMLLTTSIALNLLTLIVNKIRSSHSRRSTSNHSVNSRESSHRVGQQITASISLIPIILSALTILVTVSTTSAIGLMLVFVMQSCYTAVSWIKGCTDIESRGVSPRNTNHQIHLMISLMMMFTCFSSFPLMLFWFSRGCRLFLFFPYDHLQDMSDPHMIPAVILIGCTSILWQDRSISGRTRTSITSQAIMSIIRFISILMTSCCHNLQLIPPFVALIVASMTCQMIAGADVLIPGSHCHHRNHDDVNNLHLHQE